MMGKFYGVKILSGEINSKTGEPWKIEDVPKLWQNATRKWLAENAG